MKKAITAALAASVLLGSFHGTALASAYPALPKTEYEHYIIYETGDTIKAVQFNCTADICINLNRDSSLVASGEYLGGTEYTFQGGSWTQSGSADVRIADSVSELIESDMNVIDYNRSIRLYGQDPSGRLKDLPEIVIDPTAVTQASVSYDILDGQIEDNIPSAENALKKADDLAETGHFLDIEGDERPNEQKRYNIPGGYAIVPSPSGELSFPSTNAGVILPRIDYDPYKYNKIYFTDHDHNLKYIAEADYANYGDDSNYIIGISGILTANGMCFAVMRRVHCALDDDHMVYFVSDDIVGLVNDTVITIPEYKICDAPFAANDKITILNTESDGAYTERAVIDGNIYEIVSEMTDAAGFYFGYSAGDYFMKQAKDRDIPQTDDEFINNYYRIDDELYFTRDYVNYVTVPLAAPTITHRNPSLPLYRIDDRTYAYLTIDSDSEIGSANIISLDIIDKLMRDELPDGPVYVAYKDKLLSFKTAPRIIDSRTMVPLRFFFEEAGAEVSWDESSKTASFTLDGVSASVTVDSHDAVLNGTAVTLDVPAKLINGKTMVPLRFIAESLGMNVNWDEANRLVTVE